VVEVKSLLLLLATYHTAIPLPQHLEIFSWRAYGKSHKAGETKTEDEGKLVPMEMKAEAQNIPSKKSYYKQ
jgi:hypothetical protein